MLYGCLPLATCLKTLPMKSALLALSQFRSCVPFWCASRWPFIEFNLYLLLVHSILIALDNEWRRDIGHKIVQAWEQHLTIFVSCCPIPRLWFVFCTSTTAAHPHFSGRKGTLDSSFGKSGKVKIRLHGSGPTPKVKDKAVLRFKKYLFNKSVKLVQ